MTRYYRVRVETKDLTEVELKTLLFELGWETSNEWEHEGVFSISGEGCLCGGQSEKEAHEEMIKTAKELFKKDVKLKSHWTYLEELPYETYGSLD